MGQLDEAIKAHLELKRKHGASEEELQAEEQEALGPVRREPPPPAEAEGSADFDLEDEAAEEETAPAADYEEPLEEFEPQAYEETEALDEPEFELEDERLDPLDRADVTEPLEAVEPEAEPALGTTPPRGFEAVEDPELEDEEDVLEETPDFLQETPEHDRLWFEQKPPRDFDFDE
jgi:hypothetical protein